MAGFFWPTQQGQLNSYEALQQRRRIAEAMVARQRAFPKNLGEGLTAIGDAIGDRSYMDRLATDELASKAYEASQSTTTAPPGTTYKPYEPPEPPAATTAPPAAAAPGPQAAAPSGVHPNVASWNSFATRPYEQGGLGVAPHQAAGVVGNLQAESGPGIKPWGLVGDSGTAFGAAQWRNDRFKNLQGFAAANGMDPKTTEAQQAFMRHEMRGSGPYGGGSEARAYSALSGAQDPRSAATAFNTSYERSADRSGRREAAAVNLARILADPNASPRDRVAAVEATRTAETPLGPSDAAQEATMSDVMGSRAPQPLFAPTASNRTGDIQSDLPPVTGAVSGPMGASVGDTVQQRQETLRPPQGAVPTPPPGPQVAQAQPSVFPPVSSDAPKAIIPGGGLPQQIPAAPPQIPAAPPDPRSQVQKAPDAPDAPAPMAKPPPPVLEPLDNERTRHFQRQAADPRLPPLARQAAHEQMKTEQEQIKAYNAQRVNEYGVYMKQYVEEQAKRRDPATVYSTEKARRELQGEGATPLTPEQRAQFGIPATQPAYMTRRGEVKFGPAGQTINVDTKASVKGDEELQKKMSEHIIKTFEAGDAAGDELKQLADMRALSARVGTGPGTVIKQALGKWGIKTEGLSEIQALQAGISRLIPQQRVPGSGTTSDFDAGMFQDSVVSLSKTPEGNNLIFDTMEGLAKNKLDRAEVAGKVIAGDMTRAEAAKALLGLQQQARGLSDKVKAHLEATGQLKTVDPATPKVVSDDVMRDFLRDNPNHPRAPEIRRQLGM